MRELSIFCDESGDFGPYDSRCPYYIVALVFHNQSSAIDGEVKLIEDKVSYLGFDPDAAIHTAPFGSKRGVPKYSSSFRGGYRRYKQESVSVAWPMA